MTGLCETLAKDCFAAFGRAQFWTFDGFQDAWDLAACMCCCLTRLEGGYMCKGVGDVTRVHEFCVCEFLSGKPVKL